MKNIFLHKYSIFLFSFFIIIIISFIFLRAPSGFPLSSNFSITDGQVLTDISHELEKNNLIKSPLVFQFFVILYGGEKHIISGDYFFERPLSVFSIAKRLSKGQYNQKGIKITIPEGFSNEEIGLILKQKLNNFDSDNFIKIAKEKEGYLFPDTYYFFPSIMPGEVVKIMSNNFNLQLAPYQDEIKNFNKNLNTIIVMASIIEKESGSKDDREEVAGILWKRIEEGMRLQVDVAPETYKLYGLPEKPIANPGLQSILASIKPRKSPFYYYVHDDNGIIHYAKSYSEHRSNINKFLK